MARCPWRSASPMAKLVELLTAKDGITWTIILTSPKGISCLIASGDGWQPLAPIPTGPAV